MIRKAMIAVLTVFGITAGTIWFVNSRIGQPGVFSAVALPFDWGDPDDGTYRKVVFTAVRGSFSAYSYIQVAPSRRVNQLAYRLGSLGVGQSAWSSMQYNYANAPGWIPATLLMLYPTIAFIRGPVRRYRRRKRGLCLQCGYDLTGNVTCVCSECGTEIESRR